MITLLLGLILTFNFLCSSQPEDIEKHQQEARELIQKHGLENVNFIIKDGEAKDGARAHVSLGTDGIIFSIIFSCKFWNILTEDQRKHVLCHEIAHLKRKHHLIAPFFWIAGSAAKNITPFIIMKHLLQNKYKGAQTLPSQVALCLGARSLIALSSDIFNAWLARHCESQADRDALLMTENLAAAIGALKVRKEVNPDDTTFLGRLFADHPTADERIEYLRGISLCIRL